MSFLSSLTRKKTLEDVKEDAGDPNEATEHGGHAISGGLKRSLGAHHLTALGVGAIIGAGIFSLTGTAAATYAGPGIVYSFVIGGILCTFAGLCYAELASMIPVAGSAYAYSYTTMGELIAWIIGWDLILEYSFGAVTVSVAWSGYLISIVEHSFGIELADWVKRLTHGPMETVTLSNQEVVHGLWNVPASFIGIVVAIVLYRGITESAWVNNLIVILKVTIILVFILLGVGMIQGDLLVANPAATGLASLVPEPHLVDGVSHYGWGVGGVLTGAGVVFFAYIGFDAVSTTAQEAKNPKRDLPIGILASLAICTVLYILVALVLTGVKSYTELNVPDPIALGIDEIVRLRGWSVGAQRWFTFAIKLGALAGLSSVILVMVLAQTRIFYAMSRDGLLPWFKKTHPRFHSPHIATVVTGGFVAFFGGILDIRLVGELVSIGTLLAFVLVCLGVPILRRLNPEFPRPFKVPAPWVVGPLGAIACLWVMAGLPVETWLRLFVWLVIGFVIYFAYGRLHSRLAKRAAGGGSGDQNDSENNSENNSEDDSS